MERFEITAHKGPVDEEIPVVVLRRQGPPFLELKDLLFDTNSAVPLLSASESLREFHLIDILAAALAYGHMNPDRVCMIYGHADAAGDEPDNQELSRKRAVAIKALLLGEETSFLSIATGTPFITVQKILASLDAGMGMHCHPGALDGLEGPASAKAIKRFRQGYNELFDARLSDLDHFEHSSWQAFFRIVQDQIREALIQQGLERSELKFRLASQRGGIVPCGERRPIEAKYRNNFRSQKNRRVELVFYLEKDIPEEEKKNHFRPVPFEPSKNPMFELKGVTLSCGHCEDKNLRDMVCQPGGTLEIVCPPMQSDPIIARCADGKKVLLKWELEGHGKMSHVGTSFRFDVPGVRNPVDWIPEIEDFGWLMRGEWDKIKGCQPHPYKLIATSPLGQQFEFNIISYPNLKAKFKVEFKALSERVNEFWEHLQEAADFLIDAPKAKLEFLKGSVSAEGVFKEDKFSPQAFYQFKVEGSFMPLIGASVSIPIMLPDRIVPKFARKWMYEIDPRFTLTGGLDFTVHWLRKSPETNVVDGKVSGNIGVGVSLKVKAFGNVIDAKFDAKSRITAEDKFLKPEDFLKFKPEVKWSGLSAQFTLSVFSGKFEMGSEFVTLVPEKRIWKKDE